jgi:hypothetical protein
LNNYVIISYFKQNLFIYKIILLLTIVKIKGGKNMKKRILNLSGVIVVLLLLISISLAIGETTSQTELEITDVRGGLFSVEVDVTNTGEAIAEDVSISIFIQGGIFNKIHVFHECSGCTSCGTTLEPGLIKTEKSREGGILIGFGNVEIIVNAGANNADLIEETLQGYVIGPLVIVK